MTWIIGALIALMVLREWSFALERRDWVDERSDLLDRIQSPDLAQYKALTVKTEQPKEPDKNKELAQI